MSVILSPTWRGASALHPRNPASETALRLSNFFANSLRFMICRLSTGACIVATQRNVNRGRWIGNSAKLAHQRADGAVIMLVNVIGWGALTPTARPVWTSGSFGSHL